MKKPNVVKGSVEPLPPRGPVPKGAMGNANAKMVAKGTMGNGTANRTSKGTMGKGS